MNDIYIVFVFQIFFFCFPIWFRFTRNRSSRFSSRSNFQRKKNFFKLIRWLNVVSFDAYETKRNETKRNDLCFSFISLPNEEKEDHSWFSFLFLLFGDSCVVKWNGISIHHSWSCLFFLFFSLFKPLRDFDDHGSAVIMVFYINTSRQF